ncbi:hypothetical protein [Fontibacillus sp. BL9]|uniref:hypothetical protein n=1 Tax=Fontibacillus sp. BL9 TaxID=3389971 RepID=UPI0039790E1C
MKKIRSLIIANLVFFIPAIILSGLVWKDYRGYIRNIDDHLPSLAGIYMIDEGKRLVGVSDNNDGGYTTAYLFDAASATFIKKVKLRTNIHGELGAVSYQQNGVIIPAYDDSLGLQLNYFTRSGEMEELAQGSLHIPAFLSSGTYEWRGRLIISGEAPESGLYIAQVKAGQLETVPLNTPSLLPARPVHVMEVHGSFENDKAVPMFEIDLKDDRTAFVSGIFDKTNLPSVVVKNEEEGSFDAEDRAAALFAKQFGIDNSRLIREDSDYPGKAKFYDANESNWGAEVPTPKPVYQARVFLLNDQEVLIAGSTTEDELNGTVLGYLYNEKTGKSIDVTGLLGQLKHEDLKNEETSFFKEPESNMLYFAIREQAASGSLNLDTQDVMILTGEQVEGWLIGKGEDVMSPQSFWNYVKEGGPLILNWMIWLLIPILSILAFVMLPMIAMKSNARKISQGRQLPGTILRMDETGTYVNELPLVRFTVRFEDEGQMKEVSIKKVISFLNDVKVGDSVLISYNRKKHKAVFVTGDNVQEQPKPDLIKDAVLSRIETLGAVNRGQALQLHFKAEVREYAVPVVQPPGFEYRVGERANLMLVQGMARIYSYGKVSAGLAESEQITLEGEVIAAEEYPVTVGGRQLMLLEIMISEGAGAVRKVNSLFVPKGLPVKAGLVIPVTMRKDDYRKELRLQKGKQGAAKVVSVEFSGTLGERPLAEITAERSGIAYRINQTIEPVYGVEPGDELWIAYDEVNREAIILNYASK